MSRSDRPVRVVVVEDSPTMRAILHKRLTADGDIDVVASAANAAEGRRAIRECDPDVITLDVEMPGMNGLDFLEKIMQLRPTPVVVVSGATQHGNDITARALALGAVDCYAKDQGSGALPLDDGGKLARLVREAAKARFAPRPSATAPAMPAMTTSAGLAPPRLIVIGASTGGVEALHTLLAQFPEDCPPTLVVQHINERFAAAIARTLDEVCRARVLLAQPDLPLRPGHIYFPPDNDRHLSASGDRILHARLRRGDRVSGHRPSVDVLFESAARVAGAKAIGVLLTGMGTDGAQGLLAMARAGARTIAQDEATCTVFGMPRAAIALGAAGVVAPIGQISRHIFSKAN